MDRLLDCVRYGRDRASSSRRAKARVRQQREGSEGVHKDQLHSICISSESSRGVQSHESTDQKLNLSRIRPLVKEKTSSPPTKSKKIQLVNDATRTKSSTHPCIHTCTTSWWLFLNTTRHRPRLKPAGLGWPAWTDHSSQKDTTRFRLNFVGGGTRFGLIFFSQEGDDVRSNELFHWLANQTNEMRQTSFFCKNVCRDNT